MKIISPRMIAQERIQRAVTPAQHAALSLLSPSFPYQRHTCDKIGETQGTNPPFCLRLKQFI